MMETILSNKIFKNLFEKEFLLLQPKRIFKIGFKPKVLALIAALAFGCGANSVLAQDSQSVLYVPLIGITSVPEPLALPKGPGSVIYHYAVKNFLPELPLAGIQVTDDKCGPVVFVEGDDNGDSLLDYSETWRYACSAELSVTTQSTATAVGSVNNITATHSAYATVIVGSNNPAPLVSIINITKVAYPLSLPTEGGKITFTYKVNNPGAVPLSNVAVTDDKCSAMSGKLGDTNGNNFLDINEVWIYTCTTTLKQTTTNTASVRAFANGLEAVGNATITVRVDIPAPEVITGFPNVGGGPDPAPNLKVSVWKVLSAVLAALVMLFFLTRKSKSKSKSKKQ